MLALVCVNNIYFNDKSVRAVTVISPLIEWAVERTRECTGVFTLCTTGVPPLHHTHKTVLHRNPHTYCVLISILVTKPDLPYLFKHQHCFFWKFHIPFRFSKKEVSRVKSGRIKIFNYKSYNSGADQHSRYEAFVTNHDTIDCAIVIRSRNPFVDLKTSPWTFFHLNSSLKSPYSLVLSLRRGSGTWLIMYSVIII